MRLRSQKAPLCTNGLLSQKGSVPWPMETGKAVTVYALNK